MDGNGRWAEQRGLSRTVGHRHGSDSVRSVVRAARRLGIGALTLFAFSEQNWGRPEREVASLMVLLREFLLAEREEILDNGIRLRAVGNLGRLPDSVRSVLEPLRSETARQDGMVLTLALSYGGREEIAEAARAVCAAVLRGELAAEQVTSETLARHIPSVAVGDPDLVIRTGGEMRVSNFLLWGLAYAELHFSNKLWPEFGADDLHEAIAAYQERERRFGLTPPQVTSLRAWSPRSMAVGGPSVRT